MEQNRFREMVRSRRFAAGMFSFIPAEAIVDLAGFAGFDFLIFDTEHASYDVAWIERMVRASEAAGLVSVVRISHLDPYLIARVLDTGVDGLMFARVSSATEVEAIVRTCALPPVGTRGACPGSRAGQYFLLPQDEYTRRSSDVAIAIMIESREALEDIEAIVAVQGIDAVAVGPTDLSFTLGVTREDPAVLEAQRKVWRLAREAGLGVMASAKSIEEVGRSLGEPGGPSVFWYTTDAYQIGNCFRGLIQQSRQLLAEHALS